MQKYAGINIWFILICLESGLYRNHGSVWSLGPKRRPVLKSLYRAYDNRTVYAAYLRLLYPLIQHFLLFTEVNGALDNIFRHFFLSTLNCTLFLNSQVSIHDKLGVSVFQWPWDKGRTHNTHKHTLSLKSDI